MPVASKIPQEPAVLCQSSRLKFADALGIARAAAHKSRGYDSEARRNIIRRTAVEAFGGKEPYQWQIDACEAILLGLDCIVIAGTGAGKSLTFAMVPFMVPKSITWILAPLNYIEEQLVKDLEGWDVRAVAINQNSNWEEEKRVSE